MKTILVADDNALMRQTIRGLLEQDHDWKIIEAADGQEALSQTAQLHPDLVVLDYNMPGLNGLEAAALIRRERPRLPLILFTVHKNAFIEKEAFEKGCSVVFSKGEDALRLVPAARLLLKYSDNDSYMEPAPQNPASLPN